MFQQIQKLVAGAVCVLALTAAAPAHAHEIVAGRAGAVQKLTFTGDAPTARKIADEFVGLIHIVAMDHRTDTLSWSLMTRDGKQPLLVAEAQIDDEEVAIHSQGEIAMGALQRAKVSVKAYLDGLTFCVDLQLSLDDTQVAFTQDLEPREEPGW